MDAVQKANSGHPGAPMGLAPLAYVLYTFTIASDGDMQEGVSAEASSLAGHWGLGRLIAFYDDNKIQLASRVDKVMTENVAERYAAYGWHVEDVGNDLSVERLESAIR